MWLRIEDNFHRNRKVETLSDRAFRLHVYALCLCSRDLTDGVVSEPALRGLLGETRATSKHVKELADAGLWRHQSRMEWEINDFLDFNPSRDEVLAERAAAAERMRSVRANKRRTFGRSSGEVQANVQANVRENFGRTSGELREKFGDPDPYKDLLPTYLPSPLEDSEGRSVGTLNGNFEAMLKEIEP